MICKVYYMLKKTFIIISLFIFYNTVAYSSETYDYEANSFEDTVSTLARKCKDQNCNQEDILQLKYYIVSFCQEMTINSHWINKQLFESYISSPMLNTAFLRGWSWLNSDLSWAGCVICLLDYPLEQGWENHFKVCEAQQINH